LTRMTGALWQSGFVAALFALHPFNVESVAWIAERKNVLSTFFWLLTMWSYIRYVEIPSFSRYMLTALFFVMGLMTKAMLVTLPFVLLMLDFWPLGRRKLIEGSKDSAVKLSRLIWEKIPLLILAVCSSIVTFILAKDFGAFKNTEDIFMSTRIANAMVSYVTYLGKTFWPSGLAVFYPHPGNTIPAWKTLFCVALLIVISLIAIKWLKKAPYFAFGWFWFLGTLAPVVYIVLAGRHGMSDRYAYVTLIGIFIVIAWGLTDLLAKWNHKEKAPVLFAGLLIPLIIATWIQAGLWKNGITLFQHAINVTTTKSPGLSTTHALLANAYHRKGELDLAVSEFEKSLEINPDNLYSLNNLASTLAEQGNLEEALGSTQKLVSSHPDYEPGVITMGNILEELGEFINAQVYYKRALELDSNSFENHLNLANVLYRIGNLAETIPHFKKAIALNPKLVEAHYNLGNAFGQSGHLKEAKKSFKQAIRLNDRLPLPHYGMGVIHLRDGQYSKAISAFERALILNPKLEQAQHFLAEAHEKMGQK
jgi:tetratricopeptide (TPR) repeat protein